MKQYNRIMLGEGGKFVKDCLENNYIGVNFLKDVNLSDIPHTDENDWRQEQITKYLTAYPEKSIVTARMAIGFLWTVCYGLKIGDIVLASNGEGGYRVAEIEGNYYYARDEMLPHRRKVKWLDVVIERRSMSHELQNSAGSIGTCCNISKYASKLEQLIAGDVSSKTEHTDGAFADIHI